MSVMTHSLRAFAASKQMSLIKALHQLWIISHERLPTLDTEIIGISADLEFWRRTGQLPQYAKTALDHERLMQIEHHARASPQGFANFP